MSHTNMDTGTSADSDPNGVFYTCEAYAETVPNDDYWCWSTEEGDYSQIWFILALLFAMYAAQFLLMYTSFINRSMGVRAIHLPTQSTESMVPFPKIIHRNKSNDFVSLLLNLIIHIIFIFIKITIVSSNYLSTMDHQYETMELQQFMNAGNILLLIILTLSPVSFILNNIIFRRTEAESNAFRKNLLIPFGYILLLTDITFILIVLCIYYSLLIMLLYLFAVGLLTACIAGCVFICFVILFTAFIVRCCVNNQCIRLIEDDSGDVIIEFPTIFAQFLFFTLIMIFLFGFVFCFAALDLFFVWCFLGGPPHTVYYANFNKNADSIIYWSFILVAAFGFSAVIGTTISLCNICYDNGGDDERDEQGIHLQVTNDSDS